MRGENSSIIQVKEITDIQKREIAWSIFKLLQQEGLSYRQAVELLDDTKDQLKNIPVLFPNR